MSASSRLSAALLTESRDLAMLTQTPRRRRAPPVPPATSTTTPDTNLSSTVQSSNFSYTPRLSAISSSAQRTSRDAAASTTRMLSSLSTSPGSVGLTSHLNLVNESDAASKLMRIEVVGAKAAYKPLPESNVAKGRLPVYSKMAAPASPLPLAASTSSFERVLSPTTPTPTPTTAVVSNFTSPFGSNMSALLAAVAKADVGGTARRTPLNLTPDMNSSSSSSRSLLLPSVGSDLTPRPASTITASAAAAVPLFSPTITSTSNPVSTTNATLTHPGLLARAVARAVTAAVRFNKITSPTTAATSPSSLTAADSALLLSLSPARAELAIPTLSPLVDSRGGAALLNLNRVMTTENASDIESIAAEETARLDDEEAALHAARLLEEAAARERTRVAAQREALRLAVRAALVAERAESTAAKATAAANSAASAAAAAAQGEGGRNRAEEDGQSAAVAARVRSLAGAAALTAAKAAAIPSPRATSLLGEGSEKDTHEKKSQAARVRFLDMVAAETAAAKAETAAKKEMAAAAAAAESSLSSPPISPIKGVGDERSIVIASQAARVRFLSAVSAVTATVAAATAAKVAAAAPPPLPPSLQLTIPLNEVTAAASASTSSPPPPPPPPTVVSPPQSPTRLITSPPRDPTDIQLCAGNIMMRSGGISGWKTSWAVLLLRGGFRAYDSELSSALDSAVLGSSRVGPEYAVIALASDLAALEINDPTNPSRVTFRIHDSTLPVSSSNALFFISSSSEGQDSWRKAFILAKALSGSTETAANVLSVSPSPAVVETVMAPTTATAQNVPVITASKTPFVTSSSNVPVNPASSATATATTFTGWLHEMLAPRHVHTHPSIRSGSVLSSSSSPPVLESLPIGSATEFFKLVSSGGGGEVSPLAILAGPLGPSLAQAVDGAGRSAVHFSAMHDWVHLLLALSAEGGDIRARDSGGLSPLAYAARTGAIGALEFLLDRGVNPNQQSLHGLTPLHHATLAASTSAVKCLLNGGADSLIIDSNGLLPRDVAEREKARRGISAGRVSQLSAIRLLLLAARPGAKEIDATKVPIKILPSQTDNINFLAKAESNDVEGLRVALLGPNANELLTAKGRISRTALLLAAQGGALESIKVLLNAGASLNAVDAGGRTALALAAREGRYSCVSFLLDAGLLGDVSPQGIGLTPLHEAVIANSPDCVSLIAHRAPAALLIKDANGRTPRELAIHILRADVPDSALVLKRLEDIELLLINMDANEEDDGDVSESTSTTTVFPPPPPPPPPRIPSTSSTTTSSFHSSSPPPIVTTNISSSEASAPSTPPRGRSSVRNIQISSPLRPPSPAVRSFLEAVDANDVIKVNKSLSSDPQLMREAEESIALLPPLLRAARRGSLPIAKALVEAGADLFSVSANGGFQALHLAARQGNLELLSWLITAGCDISATDAMNLTPLHQAVLSGSVRACRILVFAGASLDIADLKGHTPRMLAFYRVNDSVTPEEKEARLVIANFLTDAEVARAMGGPLPEAPPSPRSSPLPVEASSSRSLASSPSNRRISLSSIPPPSSPRSVTSSPSNRSISNRSISSVPPPLSVAKAFYKACEQYDMATVRKFLSSPDGPSLAVLADEMSPHRYPIHFASRGGAVEVLKLLVQVGASITVNDDEGRPPLSYASRAGHADAVAYLVSLGASVSAADGTSLAPLHYAALSGNAKICTILLDAGASKDTLDKNGFTPSQLADRVNSPDAVKLLLTSPSSLPTLPSVPLSSSLLLPPPPPHTRDGFTPRKIGGY